MNKKPFLIKQFPITKISELMGKRAQKQIRRIKKSTQIYNKLSYKKTELQKPKISRTQNRKEHKYTITYHTNQKIA